MINMQNLKKDLSILLVLALLINALVFNGFTLDAFAADGNVNASENTYWFITDGGPTTSAEYDTVKFLLNTETDQNGNLIRTASDISIPAGVTIKADEVVIDNGESTYSLSVYGTLEAKKIIVNGTLTLADGGTIIADEMVIDGSTWGNLNANKVIINGDASGSGFIDANEYIFNSINVSNNQGYYTYPANINAYFENNTDEDIVIYAFGEQEGQYKIEANTKGYLIPHGDNIVTDINLDFGECLIGHYPQKTISFTNDTCMEMHYIFVKDEDGIIKYSSDYESFEEEDENITYYVESGDTLTINIDIDDSYDKAGELKKELLFGAVSVAYLADEMKLTINATITNIAPTPKNPYTLSGTKGKKGDYYVSDVILKPAAGYKVSLNSNGSNAKDSITYTQKTEDVVIYLVDADGFVTKPIEVGTITPNVVEEEEETEVKEETKEEKKTEEPGLLEGKASVSVTKAYYGGTYDVTASSSTNGSKATIKYKSKITGNYLNGAPTVPGQYVVDATFPANDKYSSVTATCYFSIEYLPAPASPFTLTGKKGSNEFYTSDITVTPAEGYLIASSLDGTYGDSLTISDKSNIRYAYLKKVSTGEMTDGIYITDFKMDKVKPAVNNAIAGKEYFSDNFVFSVSDDNLSSVKVNGKDIEFKGRECEIRLDPDGDTCDYTVEITDAAGNVTTSTFTVSSEWLKDKTIVPNKNLKLRSGQKYKLPKGKWKVKVKDGAVESTEYKGGGEITVSSDVVLYFTN